MSYNKTTEQPIPDEEFERIVGDSLNNCPKDAPAGIEAGRWKHGYIQGGKAEYIRAHSLPPSPVGEAGERFVKCSDRMPPAGQKIYYCKYGLHYEADNPPYRGTIFFDHGFHPSDNIYHIFEWLDESPNPSRAGEISPVLPRWVKARECKPAVGKVIWRGKDGIGTSFKNDTFWKENGWEGSIDFQNIEWLEEAPPTAAPEVKEDPEDFECDELNEEDRTFPAEQPAHVPDPKGEIPEEIREWIDAFAQTEFAGTDVLLDSKGKRRADRHPHPAAGGKRRI